MSEKIIDLINKFQDVGTPIEEHAAKVFAFRDEFIAYINGSNHSLEWLQAKLNNYSVHGFMAIVKEAREKGLTFEEVENIRGEALKRMLSTAVESLIAEGKITRVQKEF